VNSTDNFSGNNTPFGRKIHWVKPSIEEPDIGTIFGEAMRTPRASLQFDKQLLDELFTPHSARGTASGSGGRAITPRRWSAPPIPGIRLLDSGRAQNVAIIFSKLPMTTHDICKCIQVLNSGHPMLRPEHIEIISTAIPTSSEANKLLEYKTRKDELRDVEQRMLPLCFLSPIRMRIMRFALSHQFLFAALKERCCAYRHAADEARNSLPLKELMSIILLAGNYINTGDAGNCSAKVKAFGIESFQSLSHFKIGPVSCLHFLCLTMRSSDPTFMVLLKNSLRSLALASKDKMSSLQSEVEAFTAEVLYIKARLKELMALKQHVDACEDADDNNSFWYAPMQQRRLEDRSEAEVEEDLVIERLSMLLADVSSESAYLVLELRKAQAASTDVQAYFGATNQSAGATSTPQVPAEQFFGYIQGFLNMLQATWQEIERNPVRWRHFKVKKPGNSTDVGTLFARQLSEGAPAYESTDTEASSSGLEATPSKSNTPRAVPKASPRPLVVPRLQLQRHLETGAESTECSKPPLSSRIARPKEHAHPPKVPRLPLQRQTETTSVATGFEVSTPSNRSHQSTVRRLNSHRQTASETSQFGEASPSQSSRSLPSARIALEKGSPHPPRVPRLSLLRQIEAEPCQASPSPSSRSSPSTRIVRVKESPRLPSVPKLNFQRNSSAETTSAAECDSRHLFAGPERIGRVLSSSVLNEASSATSDYSEDSCCAESDASTRLFEEPRRQANPQRHTAGGSVQKLQALGTSPLSYPRGGAEHFLLSRQAGQEEVSDSASSSRPCEFHVMNDSDSEASNPTESPLSSEDESSAIGVKGVGGTGQPLPHFGLNLAGRANS
jgi:hypothetical protein